MSILLTLFQKKKKKKSDKLCFPHPQPPSLKRKSDTILPGGGRGGEKVWEEEQLCVLTASGHTRYTRWRRCFRRCHTLEPGSEDRPGSALIQGRKASERKTRNTHTVSCFTSQVSTLWINANGHKHTPFFQTFQDLWRKPTSYEMYHCTRVTYKSTPVLFIDPGLISTCRDADEEKSQKNSSHSHDVGRWITQEAETRVLTDCNCARSPH